MADPARARRLAKRISAIVASAIEYEIKDPPLGGVTITDAKVTADLHDATLYYTVMGPTLDDEPDYAGAAAALERAKGVLRTKVGAGTGVRFTPTLTFIRDTVPDAAHRMEELLARARAADADLARVRSGAKPAGDADPYRASGAPDVPAGTGLARGGAGQLGPGTPDVPAGETGQSAHDGGALLQGDAPTRLRGTGPMAPATLDGVGTPLASGGDAGDDDQRKD